MKLEIFNTPLSFLLLGILHPVNSVINGVFSVKRDWFVLFTRESAGSLYPTVHCGGALIGADMVLTAAHCFDGLQTNPDGLPGENADTAWVGKQATCNFNQYDQGKTFDIERYFLPSEYDINDPYNEGDIALVKLSERDPACDTQAGTFSDNTNFASYQEVSLNFSTSVTMFLYGFGRIASFQDTSELLRFGEAEYKSTEPCSSRAEGYNPTVHLCTEDAISCQGDSGGPLLYGDTIVGIASYMDEDYGEYCGGTDVYTRVSNYDARTFATVCRESAYPPSSCRTTNWHAEDAFIGKDLPKPPTVYQRMITRARGYLWNARSYILGDWFN